MTPADAPILAAFDLDGTLTTSDTFLPFLARVGGRSSVAVALAASGTTWLGEGRDAAKAASVRRALSGHDLSRLEQLGVVHAEQIVGCVRQRPWRPGLRKGTVERLQEHVRLGHRVVVVSASLRVYVAPIAAALGITEVIATDLAVDDRGRATGELLGANCRGAEKVARLERLIEPDWTSAWAYGDSSGDREMIERAANGVWVRKGRLEGPVPR